MANQLPKHINHVLKDRKAVAPYNFVELPDKIVEAEPSLPDGDRYHDHKENPSHPNEIKRYSGRVKCTLTPESQIYENLIIPNQNHKKYEIHKIPRQNTENHKNLNIPQHKNENHEFHRIPRQNQNKC